MSIVFYGAPMSSASPVRSALHELEVPHERVAVDLKKGDQKKPEFLKLNPNGKVPTIVVDGQPMFEAIAIMQWLGDRFGVARGLWPSADSPARLRALSFTTWAYVQYASEVKVLNYASSPQAPEAFHNAAVAEAARNQLQELLGVLEREFAASPYLLGTQFSLADLIVAAVVVWSTYCGVSTDAHPKVCDWLERCKARPSMQVESA